MRTYRISLYESECSTSESSAKQSYFCPMTFRPIIAFGNIYSVRKWMKNAQNNGNPFGSHGDWFEKLRTPFAVRSSRGRFALGMPKRLFWIGCTSLSKIVDRRNRTENFAKFFPYLNAGSASEEIRFSLGKSLVSWRTPSLYASMVNVQ